MIALATPRQLFCEADTEIALPFPREVEMILSAMNVGQYNGATRRAYQRTPYNVRAQLRLFSHLTSNQPWTLYTRDVNIRGLGFITSHRLPLGHGGMVEIPTFELLGRERRLAQIQCTVFRCRETAPGWYEGSVSFNRDQPDFAPHD